MSRPPEEFIRPPVEHSSAGVPEIMPPGDEFPHTVPAPETPKKKRKLLQLAAGVIAAAVAVGVFSRPVPPAAEPAPTPPAPTAETTPPPTETAAPTPLPDPTVLTEPESLASYDNPGGICVITVYGDLFDFDVFGNPILLEETVEESSFTELILPEFPVYEGCSALGYVIEYGPFSADFTAVGYNPDTAPFAAAVGRSLTPEELRLVPVWEEDGIRHVYLHPVWITNEGAQSWAYAPVVTLDDGQKVVEYPLDLPLASGGTFYVCAVVPMREGYRFAGWYDADGEIVYSVCAEDLFTTHLEGSDEIDWKAPTNITLTARWVSAS